MLASECGEDGSEICEENNGTSMVIMMGMYNTLSSRSTTNGDDKKRCTQLSKQKHANVVLLTHMRISLTTPNILISYYFPSFLLSLCRNFPSSDTAFPVSIHKRHSLASCQLLYSSLTAFKFC